MSLREHIEGILPRVTSPGQYIGGEWNVRSLQGSPPPRTRIGLVHPEPYARGACDLLLQGLYALLNDRRATAAERFFSPWIDMESEMRRAGIPLFSLESARPLSEFDLAILLMTDPAWYASLVNLLDLGRVPLWTGERSGEDPWVVGVAPYAVNPEPLAGILDLFVAGEPEATIPSLLDRFEELRGKSLPREQAVASLAGRNDAVLAPGLEPGPRGGPAARARIAWVPDLEALPAGPPAPVVPFIRADHASMRVEIARGAPPCGGLLPPGAPDGVPPLRTRSIAAVARQVEGMARRTGYADLELCGGIGQGDPGLARLLEALERAVPSPRGSLTLPPLPVAPWVREILVPLARWSRPELRLAVVAGRPGLRASLGRPFEDDDLLELVHDAFDARISSVELAFLVGLPGETPGDAGAIGSLVRACHGRRRGGGRNRGRLRATVTPFVPLPFTAWEGEPMETPASLRDRMERIRLEAGPSAPLVRLGDPELACLRGALARGDRAVGRVVVRAWREGCRLDTWQEGFRWEAWLRAFEAEGIDPEAAAARGPGGNRPPAWDRILAGGGGGRGGGGGEKAPATLERDRAGRRADARFHG